MTDPAKPMTLVERIKELSGKSGKPLEVEVAQSFLNWGSHPGLDSEWKVYLGTHFQDGDERIRELDVLARRIQVNETLNLNCTLEALVSCKGFPVEDHPVTFSVSRAAIPEHEEPDLLHFVRPPAKRSDLGKDTVRMLLYETRLFDDYKVLKTRRIVGFDIFRDDPKQGMRALGDRNLFEGLDSAMKACVDWARRKLPVASREDECLVRLQLPILVLQRPWHDVSIDGGAVGDPVETHWGFISNQYPVEHPPKPLTPLFCLMVSRDKLEELQKALLGVYSWFIAQGMSAVRSPK